MLYNVDLLEKSKVLQLKYGLVEKSSWKCESDDVITAFQQ
jgi:hypothetical protein